MNTHRMIHRIGCLAVIWLTVATQVRAEDLKTLDGTVYKNATITTVTPAYVTVMHAAGVARVMLQNLPPELQTKYGYDPEKAAKFAAADAEAQRRLSQQQEAARRQAAQPKEAVTPVDTANQREYTLWGTIAQILPQGIIVDPSYRGYSGSPFLVKGCPNQDKLAEGDEFHASIVDAGVITLTDISGAKRTLHAYAWRGPPK